MDPMNASSIINSTLNSTLAEATFSGTLLASTVLFILAIVPIYIGSLRSQACRNTDMLEVISSHDAAVFPLFASAALLGIFILFKFLPLEYINFLVNLHFSIIGIGSMSHLLCPLFAHLYPKFLSNHLYKIEFSKNEGIDDSESESKWKLLGKHSLEYETKDFAGLIIAISIGLWYFATRHWIANNLVALTICVLAIEYIRLNKFLNGFMLLGGLFFYDIFWVFGTPVMVAVAKNLEAPIKVVFPRDFLVHGVFGKQLALLGLGDIVVPGIFVAMLLRFDHNLNRNQSRVYFYTGYVAYIVGLLITFLVMHGFKAAQPALLYLVPTCLGFPLIRAFFQGDIKAMFDYQDLPENVESANTIVTEEKKSE